MSNIKWKISGQSVYAAGCYKIGREGQWTVVESISELYKRVLRETPVKLKKHEKFFRIGKQSAITVVMAILALQQANLNDLTDFDMTAILGVGNEGSHRENLIFWNDYVINGKIAAQGHLFVGTLASTPLCQLALSIGSHAPVYYVSPCIEKTSIAEELDFLYTQCRNLFLIEIWNDYCCCLFLQAVPEGLSSEQIICALGDIE